MNKTFDKKKAPVKYNFNKKIKIENNKEKELKIIGITGSSGKTTTAYILHEYLKNLGYKSILYSSASIDSPLTNYKKDEACEVPVRSEEALKRIITEAKLYNADYLILEINENVIEKNFINDLEFTVKVLTNLNPKHNLEQYDENEYVNLKKIFFSNINDSCKCVIGIQDYTKELLEEFLNLNNCSKYLFTSEYIASIKNIELNRIATLLYNLKSSLNGLELKVLSKGINYEFKTNLIMKHNALNLICVITIIEALEIMNDRIFQNTIENIIIPGRVETYRFNNRLCIIDLHLSKTLEYLYELKKQGQINKIIVVVGSIGSGFKNWNKKFLESRFTKEHLKNKKYAMNIISKYADHVYLTECDNGKEQAEDICLELTKYLQNDIKTTIIIDRKKAIEKALEESEENDVIFISGRGNRSIMCYSQDKVKLMKDGDIVKNILNKYINGEKYEKK